MGILLHVYVFIAERGLQCTARIPTGSTTGDKDVPPAMSVLYNSASRGITCPGLIRPRCCTSHGAMAPSDKCGLPRWPEHVNGE